MTKLADSLTSEVAQLVVSLNEEGLQNHHIKPLNKLLLRWFAYSYNAEWDIVVLREELGSELVREDWTFIPQDRPTYSFNPEARWDCLGTKLFFKTEADMVRAVLLMS